MANSLEMDFEGLMPTGQPNVTENMSNYYDNYDIEGAAPCKVTEGLPRTLTTIFLLLLLILGFFGNIWFLFKLIQNGIKKLCHVVLMAMCLNAFVGCVVVLLTTLQRFLAFSTPACQFLNFTFYFYVFFGILLVCVLCFDTWCAIWMPASNQSTSCNGVIWCTVMAGLALILTVPRVIFIKSLFMEGGLTMCYLDYGDETLYLSFLMRLFLNVFGFLLPLTFLIVFYGMCLIKLFKAVFKARTRAIRTILVLILVFLLCWGPYHLFNFLDGLLREGFLNETCELRDILTLGIEVCTLWGMTQTTLQPVLYSLCSSQLRANLFSCIRR
ncbi:hypothetical protein [Rhinolophus gammaherpesvirus 1]|uniref:G-protein coupled receptors family 1 profile domain-containing protein n=1 Tax=Rhinolophus gammaherpesvirus 1 TaxID=2054179 RepID=A0A2Z5UL94_9GAMA|nr:hypothetical protein [Rhinolophus gammaherpesvirus 1]BBB06527.1 hypothetical protein [Rhinolophus gammaherpesvirus 1]